MLLVAQGELFLHNDVYHMNPVQSINSERKRLQNERCDILVATPGRLADHLQNHGLQPKLAGLKSLILDEADRLLDQGFLNELEKIFGFLPSRKQVPRQAMLFSATMSREVKQVRGPRLKC